MGESRLIKQPRTGDQLATGRWGDVTVTAVHDHGLRLDVTDRFGRPWTIERADAGWWHRAGFHMIRTRTADETVEHVAFGAPSKVGQRATSCTFGTREEAQHEADAWAQTGSWQAVVLPGPAPDAPCGREHCARLDRHAHSGVAA